MNNSPQTACAIAYYRVSTREQGQSGLGLDAQRQSVKRYAAANGLNIASEYTEVETGTSKRQRVEIHNAIAASKQNGCKLLIAKLDRLARNVAFTSALMESGVDFVAVDMPNANNLTIHIMAAMAEHEAQMISKRTKAALDAKKARDGEWRNTSGFTQATRQRGADSMKAKALANENNRRATDYAVMLRDTGLTFQKIADKLNTSTYRTARGKQFTAMAVKRLIDRAKSAEMVTA